MLRPAFDTEFGKVAFAENALAAAADAAAPADRIKIDAEGGEHDIVRGARQVLRRDRPVVLFEMGDNALVNYPHVTSAGMAEQLTALDYRLLDILGRPLDPEAFVASCAEQSVWDYAAVPAEQTSTFDALREALAAAGG